MVKPWQEMVWEREHINYRGSLALGHSSLASVSFLGTLRGRKSSWDPLFAHALNFQEFLEFRITTRLCP